MKTLNVSKLVLAFVALSVFAFAQPIQAQDSEPIQGTLQGTLSLVPISVIDMLFRVEYHATGGAQGLGRLTTDFVSPEVQVNLAARQLVALSPSWTVDLVTKNGDVIHGVYTFQNPVIHFSQLGFFVLAADVEVNGGTGRFAGAMGSGTAMAFGNIYARRFVLRFNGTWNGGG